MAASISDLPNYFHAVSADRKWHQALALEWLPGRTVWSGLFEERSYDFIGVPIAIANLVAALTTSSSTTSVSVTDAGGTSYTVPLVEQFVDGSTGTAIVEKIAVIVDIGYFSPHLRTIRVTKRICKLRQNGAVPAGWTDPVM